MRIFASIIIVISCNQFRLERSRLFFVFVFIIHLSVFNLHLPSCQFFLLNREVIFHTLLISPPGIQNQSIEHTNGEKKNCLSIQAKRILVTYIYFFVSNTTTKNNNSNNNNNDNNDNEKERERRRKGKKRRARQMKICFSSTTTAHRSDDDDDDDD